MPKYRSLAEVGGSPDAPRVHELLKLLNEYAGAVDPETGFGDTMEQVGAWLKELKEFLPVVTVGVADGRATYVVARWPKGSEWMIFVWLEGGFDRRVSHWGLTIAVPGREGVKILKRYEALDKLFSLDVVA